MHVGGQTSIDVTNSGVDKAYAMRKLMAILGLAATDVLFFGDQLDEGGNDYPVKAMGIDTIAVEGWRDSALAIEAIVAVDLVNRRRAVEGSIAARIRRRPWPGRRPSTASS